MKGVYVRRLGGMALCGALLAVSGGARADQGRGLGAAWPNAQDVSRAPGFHAYRWDRGGVAYVQVNDASGAPVLAVAVARNGALLLPIGHPDKVRVIGRDATGVVSNPTGPVIYVDAQVEVSTTVDAYEVRLLQATAEEPCTDPVECGKPLSSTQTVTPAAAMSANSTCNDPVECGKPAQ